MSSTYIKKLLQFRDKRVMLPSGPIMQLAEAAYAVSRAQMDAPITGVKRTDEIGLPAEAVERLCNSTRLAMKWLSPGARKNRN